VLIKNIKNIFKKIVQLNVFVGWPLFGCSERVFCGLDADCSIISNDHVTCLSFLVLFFSFFSFYIDDG